MTDKIALMGHVVLAAEIVAVAVILRSHLGKLKKVIIEFRNGKEEKTEEKNDN